MLVPSSSGSSDANNLMSTPSSASAATPTYMPSLIRKMNSVSIAPSTNSSAARRSAINIRPLIRKMASVSISQSSSTIEPPGEEENLIRDAELYHYLSNLNSTRRHSSISIKNNMPPKQKRKPLIFSKVGIYCKCGKCHIITKVSKFRYEILDGDTTTIVSRSKKQVSFTCSTCGNHRQVTVIK